MSYAFFWKKKKKNPFLELFWNSIGCEQFNFLLKLGAWRCKYIRDFTLDTLEVSKVVLQSVSDSIVQVIYIKT